MRQPQRDLHQHLLNESMATRERIAGQVRPLNLAQLAEHPIPGAWSVGDVLEHLCRAEDAYDGGVDTAIARARADAGAPAREWKSSFLGSLVANSLLKAKPLTSPAAFRPGPTPRLGVAEAFIAQEMAFVTRMDNAASLDWNAVRVQSPALPRFMPSFNLGDVFRIHAIHCTRHLGQIERIRRVMSH